MPTRSASLFLLSMLTLACGSATHASAPAHGAEATEEVTYESSADPAAYDEFVVTDATMEGGAAYVPPVTPSSPPTTASVLLRIEVAADGTLGDIRVIREISGRPDITQMAIDTARRVVVAEPAEPNVDEAGVVHPRFIVFRMTAHRRE